MGCRSHRRGICFILWWGKSLYTYWSGDWYSNEMKRELMMNKMMKGLAVTAGLTLALCGGGYSLALADDPTTNPSPVKSQDGSISIQEQQEINLYDYFLVKDGDSAYVEQLKASILQMDPHAFDNGDPAPVDLGVVYAPNPAVGDDPTGQPTSVVGQPGDSVAPPEDVPTSDESQTPTPVTTDGPTAGNTTPVPEPTPDTMDGLIAQLQALWGQVSTEESGSAESQATGDQITALTDEVRSLANPSPESDTISFANSIEGVFCDPYTSEKIGAYTMDNPSPDDYAILLDDASIALDSLWFELAPESAAQADTAAQQLNAQSRAVTGVSGALACGQYVSGLSTVGAPSNAQLSDDLLRLPAADQTDAVKVAVQLLGMSLDTTPEAYKTVSYSMDNPSPDDKAVLLMEASFAVTDREMLTSEQSEADSDYLVESSLWSQAMDMAGISDSIHALVRDAWWAQPYVTTTSKFGEDRPSDAQLGQDLLRLPAVDQTDQVAQASVILSQPSPDATDTHWLDVVAQLASGDATYSPTDPSPDDRAIMLIEAGDQLMARSYNGDEQAPQDDDVASQLYAQARTIEETDATPDGTLYGTTSGIFGHQFNDSQLSQDLLTLPEGDQNEAVAQASALLGQAYSFVSPDIDCCAPVPVDPTPTPDPLPVDPTPIPDPSPVVPTPTPSSEPTYVPVNPLPYPSPVDPTPEPSFVDPSYDLTRASSDDRAVVLTEAGDALMERADGLDPASVAWLQNYLVAGQMYSQALAIPGTSPAIDVWMSGSHTDRTGRQSDGQLSQDLTNLPASDRTGMVTAAAALLNQPSPAPTPIPEPTPVPEPSPVTPTPEPLTVDATSEPTSDAVSQTVNGYESHVSHTAMSWSRHFAGNNHRH